MATGEHTDVSRGDASAGETVRVLHLDDDEAFLDLSAAQLEREGLAVVSLTDPDEALDRLATGDFDCVVSDYQMPKMNGIEFLEAVREDHPDLPFLLFTGKGSEEVAGRAISAGVTDYLRKRPGSDRFTLLANRIENTVAQYRTQRRAEESDRRVREVHSRVSDGVVAVDDDWRYTYVNGRAEELLGVDEADLLGKRLWDEYPDLVDSEFEDAFREAMRTQEPQSVEARNEDVDAWYEARVYPDEDGVSIYFRDVTERRERERRFEAIFNGTFQFTGLMEPDGTLVEANETALEFGGVDREDVVGKKVWETKWFQHGDAATVARAFTDRAAEGHFVRTDLEVQGADGVAVIDFSIRPVTDDDGEVVLLIPEGRDITELKEREEQLREERAFAESIFAGMSDPLYAFDAEGNFLRWNEELETVTGYSGEEIEEMHPLEFIPGDEHGKIGENIATVVEEERAVTVESYFETKDGERIPYEFTGAPLTDEDDELLGLVGVGRDLTERKERERRYEAVFNGTFQFSGLMEPDGTLVEANDTVLEFGGFDREDVVDHPFWETGWWDGDAERVAELKDAVERAADGEFVRYEVEVDGAEGPAIIDFSIKPVTDDDGEVVLLIPEGRDITERKERERELQRQNERLEEFANVLSHDLRNRMSVAAGSISLLDQDNEHVQRAANALDRMEQLVEDVLRLAEQGDVVDEMRPVSAREVLGDAIDGVVVDEGDVRVDCDDDCRIHADPSRLPELVENLLVNAATHGADDVEVSIGLEGDTLYVADDGPGIPPGEREAVLRPGYSTDGGTGYGLSIVKRIAEAHGWELAITESEQGGARIELRGVERAGTDDGEA